MEGAKAGSGGKEGRWGEDIQPHQIMSHRGQDRAFLISVSHHEAGLIVRKEWLGK